MTGTPPNAPDGRPEWPPLSTPKRYRDGEPDPAPEEDGENGGRPGTGDDGDPVRRPGPPGPGSARRDAELQARIGRALAAASAGGRFQRVAASCCRGEILLTGAVASRHDLARAHDLVAGQPFVRSVRSFVSASPRAVSLR